MTAVPETTALYRRLLADLTEKLGGAADDTGWEAIACAAAELSDRGVQPPLAQDASAHDVLDLLGVPRAGTFSPYTLAERLRLLVQRSGWGECATRAHDLLSDLGVPRRDDDGNDLSLTWRVKAFAGRGAPRTAEGAEDLATGRASPEVASPTLEVGDRDRRDLQAEIVALRTTVESLGNEVRERLTRLHEEVLRAPAAAGRNGVDAYGDVEAKRARNPVVVVVLVLLALILAAGAVGAVVYGWSQVRATGVLPPGPGLRGR